MGKTINGKSLALPTTGKCQGSYKDHAIMRGRSLCGLTVLATTTTTFSPMGRMSCGVCATAAMLRWIGPSTVAGCSGCDAKVPANKSLCAACAEDMGYPRRAR